jgi:hypothetical protein
VQSRLTVRLLLAVLCVCGTVSLAAAQGVGAIAGSVTDASGAVLPGVIVWLLNPGLIGGTLTTTTDERGASLFTRLVPAATTCEPICRGSGRSSGKTSS